MRFSVLASGSSGNACYIETNQSRILIDAGLSCRELSRRLELVGVETEYFDAIIVTHEHSDHIKGVGPISRRFKAPVFINALTLNKCGITFGKIESTIIIETGKKMIINDIVLETFSKCHDAVDPIGITASSNGSRLGLITDLGASTGLIKEHLKKCRAIIMEFNHDDEMLRKGPYPPFLKKRIMGENGHLSNRMAAELLGEVSHKDLESVVLAHLSKINNLPEKAYDEANGVLNSKGFDSTKIHISSQEHPLEMITI
jgi:phosphoribosyl 1,2-cyclic phosphodiesterase